MTNSIVEMLTAKGTAAVKAGRLAEASNYFKQALQVDDENVTAWFMLGRYVIDQNDRDTCNKALDKARLAALKTPEKQELYKRLLVEAGTPSLPIYLLGPNSPSVGARCPFTRRKLKEGDQIVICPNPTCKTAHTVIGWESNRL
ncbi:MAG: hypothetical protein IPK17_17585 [Chloroflexi bacterium]|uniref:tetratricopeptide repeat protein n=1 Tax=Candidatus Flexifilum breve TaxID=3140694 RepID=UPI0031370B44|nr:hypothetical protein [Chloroflexota bacterium]